MTQNPAQPTFDEILNVALKVTKSLGFTPEEQACTLGYTKPVGNNPAYLKKVLRRMNQRDVQSRCEIVMVIRAKLDAVFSGEIGTMERWLRAQHSHYGGQSMKSLMTSGERADLERALALVSEAPLPH